MSGHEEEMWRFLDRLAREGAAAKAAARKAYKAEYNRRYYAAHKEQLKQQRIARERDRRIELGALRRMNAAQGWWSREDLLDHLDEYDMTVREMKRRFPDDED